MSTMQYATADDASENAGTAPAIQLYWLPGCSACMRMKEFVEKAGKSFEAINLEAEPERGAGLQERGLWVPTAQVGDRYVNGHNLDQVAELIGVEYEPRELLAPTVLMARYRLINKGITRYVGQMNAQALEYKLPNRDRTMLMLAHHTSTIARAFLAAYYENNHDTALYGAPGDVVTRDEVLANTAETLVRMGTWWDEDGQDDPLDRILETYAGWRTLHEVFEREVWHSAQHARQLMFALEQNGIDPDGPITSADLEGLPVPERVHG